MITRPATLGDIGRVTQTLSLAFLHDPVWGVALARPDGSTDHHAAYWQIYVEGALRYSTVFMIDDASAVSVWIPPGSLLASHPDHRGQGIGQRLLAEDLARWDAEHLPAHLESTNPANDHRYERAGFRRIGGFHAVLDDAPISTMWRPSATV
jgi:GNAT superfamily N-acetyltransferase